MHGLYVNMCVFISACFSACVSTFLNGKHYGGMCETEVWVPYQSFHILLFFFF